MEVKMAGTHAFSAGLLESSFVQYMHKVKAIKLLSLEQENKLVKRWVIKGDVNAAHRLVLAHLKLVVKIAFKFKNYGLPIADLVSEGNIGLMKAIKKFRPEMGCRVSTYAMWWIKASIQSYILKSWSLVKVSTAELKKKLFYSTNKIMKYISNNLRLENEENTFDLPYEISLDQTHNGEEDGTKMIDMIHDDSAELQDSVLANSEIENIRTKSLKTALLSLSDRERTILKERRLKDSPTTLEILSKRFGISKERVRQIEEKTIQKLKKICNVESTSTL